MTLCHPALDDWYEVWHWCISLGPGDIVVEHGFSACLLYHCCGPVVGAHWLAFLTNASVGGGEGGGQAS